MIKIKKYFSACAALLFFVAFANAADIIIFSYNRPLQLEALLRSAKQHIDNLGTIYVLYRSKGNDFQTAYDELITDYPEVHFTQQKNPPHDFKPILIDLLKQSEAPYVCFAVDDIIVTDSFDMQACTDALEATGAYGFYLRLGKNITYSYNYNITLTVPKFMPVAQDIYSFHFEGKSYWAYPNTVDMTVYRKEDILPTILEMNYTSPNTLERDWHRKANLQNIGLCFDHSKMINTPLNLVQENWNNKHESAYPTEELLDLWQQGLRIDIDKVYKIDNISAHTIYIPHFVTRSTHASA